uniref:EF-hand domain-containing protein n=1 Tax=Meloidogyne incognita TaxID=6306 RepID=A0A914KQA1_MELIC
MALPPLNRQRLRNVFLIFNYLLAFTLIITESLPLDVKNLKRSNQSHHKRQARNHNNTSGQIYPAEALLPKVTKQLDDPHQSSQPQFVANNGPLIRMPDGQFVLATSVSEQQNRQLPQPIQTNQQQSHIQSESKGVEHASESPSSSPIPEGAQSSQSSITSTIPEQLTTLPTETTENELQQTSSSPFSSSTSSSSPSSTNSPTHIPSVDKSVDLDGDGALSLNEVQYAAFVHHGLSSSVVENLFNDVDFNKDGFLSSIEFNEIRPLVLAKAENAALRYLQNVDSDHNGLLSLHEAKAYILREYGISNRDVERIWRLVVPSSGDEMDAVLFSKLRRRVRGMSIRLARQIMKTADRDQDGHIDMREAAMIAFEQEGIGAGEVVEMLASVDDNNDGQLNAPEFADFERIVRAKAVETSKKALKVVDTDGSGTLTMDEAKKIAFDHYGFDEATLEPFFAQADENEDGQLDAVEFAGFRSVIRGRAVKNALMLLPEMDEDGDGSINEGEAEQRARREDDMSGAETHSLFAVADQDRNGLLDKVELADFVRLVRLTSIKFVSDHFRDYDTNRDKQITLDELERLVKDRYKLEPTLIRRFFDKVDVDRSGDLNPGEIVDFRHEVRRFAQDRVMQAELEEQNRKEMAEIEQRLRQEALAKKQPTTTSTLPPEQPKVATEETKTTIKTSEITTTNSDVLNTKTQTDSSNSQEEEEIENIGEEGKTKEKEKQVEQQTNQTNNVFVNVLENTTTTTVENSVVKMSENETLNRQSTTTSNSQLVEEKQNNKINEENVVRDKNETTTNLNIQTTSTQQQQLLGNTTLIINLQITEMATNIVNSTTTIETNKEQISTKKQKKKRRKSSTTTAPTTTTTTAEESYEALGAFIFQ